MAEVVVVPSSSGSGAYDVEVSGTPEGVKLICNCQAGQFGKLCKHKLKVIRAALGMESGAGIIGELQTISALVNSSSLPGLLHQLAESEAAVERAKKMVVRARKVLERHLVDGA